MRKNYSVTYAYFASDGGCGSTKKNMTFDEIDFLFKSISVGNCREWISAVNSLRRGSSVMIKAAESTESGVSLVKAFEIKRV